MVSPRHGRRSYTGNQFADFVALSSTIHSPNSCGQVQVADIGIMGGPAKKEIDGKKMAVPGCKIFVGGRIGEDAHLALEPVASGIPLEEEDLIPVLVDILKKDFGAKSKGPVKRAINAVLRR